MHNVEGVVLRVDRRTVSIVREAVKLPIYLLAGFIVVELNIRETNAAWGNRKRDEEKLVRDTAKNLYYLAHGPVYALVS
jgi:hypothetical protein